MVLITRRHLFDLQAPCWTTGESYFRSNGKHCKASILDQHLQCSPHACKNILIWYKIFKPFLIHGLIRVIFYTSSLGILSIWGTCKFSQKVSFVSQGILRLSQCLTWKYSHICAETNGFHCVVQSAYNIGGHLINANTIEYSIFCFQTPRNGRVGSLIPYLYLTFEINAIKIDTLHQLHNLHYSGLRPLFQPPWGRNQPKIK